MLFRSDSVIIPLSFEPGRHGGDVFIESCERFELLLHAVAELSWIVMVKDRDLSPHRRASEVEGWVSSGKENSVDGE